MTLVIALLLAQTPPTLVGRSTHVMAFIPRERSTWRLTLTADGKATLESRSEKSDATQNIGPKRRITEMEKKGREIAAGAHWVADKTTTSQGTAKKNASRLDIRLEDGGVIACVRKRRKVLVADAQLVLPPGKKDCADYDLIWKPATASQLEVYECTSELPDAPSVLAPEPGVEQIDEEDDCTGGHGLRAMSQPTP